MNNQNPNYTCIQILNRGQYVFRYKLTDQEPGVSIKPMVFLAGPFSSPMITQAKMGALNELARNHILRISSNRGYTTPEGDYEFDSSTHKLTEGLYFACTLGDEPQLVDIVAVTQKLGTSTETTTTTDTQHVSTTTIPIGS